MPRIGQDLSGVKDEDMNRGGGGWTVKPDGWYRAVYRASTYKATRKGDGMVLSFEGVFLEAGHEGDKLFENLTLEHPNPKTTEIARVRLKELAIATGYPTPDHVEDSDDLHNKPFMVRLYSEVSDNPKYGDANGMQQRIGEYKSPEASSSRPAETGPQEPVRMSEDIPF